MSTLRIILPVTIGAIVLCNVAYGQDTAQRGPGYFSYGNDFEGNKETVGPITFGDGTVGAAALFNMSSAYPDDENNTRSATEVACHVFAQPIIASVNQMRPGNYETLTIMFKWVGSSIDGVAPVLNYTSVFSASDCIHIGRNAP